MKTKRIINTVISAVLLIVFAANIAGCTARVKAGNLMDDIVPGETKPVVYNFGDSSKKAADFAVRLLKATNAEGENTLVSPLSVMCALAMTANGAKGETLSQMETVLGMSKDELNEFFMQYLAKLVNGEKYKLNMANSIWFTSDPRFTVNKDFLKANADHFGADIYRAPFDDSTLYDINNWVKKKTDGMIPEILDQIPQEAVMYLINALAFDAEWAEIYKKSEVFTGKFTLEDGTVRDTDYMSSIEDLYLDSGSATGFIKYYSGGKYAFAALLPKEGMTVSELVASLNGDDLLKLLSTPIETSVSVMLPKFETGFDIELSEVLESMGMPDAFDQRKADFTALGTSALGNIWISRVLHKTFISVDEKGTKAGAATVVEAVDECAAVSFVSVDLNRPFVYMLIDCETNLPFFIGTMMDISK